MSIKLTTPPATEPVTTDEARDFARVNGSGEDDFLDSLVATAREQVETITRRALITQTWTLKLDGFPGCDLSWLLDGGPGGGGSRPFGRYADREVLRRQYPNRDAIVLPLPPLQSVTSITYLDEAGNTQTLSPSKYAVDTTAEPARITLAAGASWPSTQAVADAVTVTFVAGYATPFTADESTDVLTALGRTYADGEVIRLTNGGGALPAPLAARTAYYVVSASGATFKLSLTLGGSAVDLTDAGQGTHFASTAGPVPASARTFIKMRVAQLYDGETSDAAALEAILSPLLWGSYV